MRAPRAVIAPVKQMNAESLGIVDAKALPYALGRTKKPVAFLVGSPLSMPERQDGPGVPGVSEMVRLVRARLAPGELPDFDKALGNAPPAMQYQQAMAFLRGWHSQDAVNEVIRQAVRRARLSQADEDLCDEKLEKDLNNWHLPTGTRDLARLLMSGDERWSGPILTTNFDPLLSIAVELEGGSVVRTILDNDRSLRGTETSGASRAVSIVHLHGYWKGGDTLHTSDQLGAARPHLSASLKRLLQKHTLLVVAYGGWDDVFTNSLADLALDGESGLEVLWTFYETEPALIAARYSSLLQKTSQARIQGRFRLYSGIDCHKIFAHLGEQSLPTTTRPLTTPSYRATHASDAQAKRPSPSLSSSPTSTAIPTPAPPATPTRPAPHTPSSTTVARRPSPISATKESGGTLTASSEQQKSSRSRISSGVALLLLIASVGYLRSGTRTDAPPKAAPPSPRGEQRSQPDPSTSSAALDTLRARHNVRQIKRTVRDAASLQAGTLGFIQMNSILNASNAPVTPHRSESAFEVHKTPNNTTLLIGYVGSAAAQAIARGESIKTPFAPTPSRQRMNLVAIPFARIRAASSELAPGQPLITLEIASTHTIAR